MRHLRWAGTPLTLVLLCVLQGVGNAQNTARQSNPERHVLYLNGRQQWATGDRPGRSSDTDNSANHRSGTIRFSEDILNGNRVRGRKQSEVRVSVAGENVTRTEELGPAPHLYLTVVGIERR